MKTPTCTTRLRIYAYATFLTEKMFNNVCMAELFHVNHCLALENLQPTMLGNVSSRQVYVMPEI